MKGFHKRHDQYFSYRTSINKETFNRLQNIGSCGEFCRLSDKMHTTLAKKLEPVNASKGSLVFFDNRLPHATCAKLFGNDSREVIYFAFIPKVALNIAYHELQKEHIRRNIPPPMYCKHDEGYEKCDKDWSEEDLSEFQLQLLDIV